MNRREFLKSAAALAAFSLSEVPRAQQIVPIADMHSHYGLIQRKSSESGLADEMRSQRVALVAWKHVADGPWLRTTKTGIEQAREPLPGQLLAHFNRSLERMKSYLGSHQLRLVLTQADVDASVAGDAGIVLASEGADFLEGDIGNLNGAYEKGLRHLQLVHYSHTPVGDFQTIAPTYNGLSSMGKQLVEVCNAKGILVDLAHSTEASVEQALDISKAPLVWSHSWVDNVGGNWQDQFGYQRRRLSLALAKKIAERGGVIGIWGLGMSRPARDWPLGAGDTRGYAYQIAALVDKIGADHVAFGTDMEGVGNYPAINSYAQLRMVVEHLQDMKLNASVIESVAYRNYARVLKSVLTA